MDYLFPAGTIQPETRLNHCKFTPSRGMYENESLLVLSGTNAAISD